jgi:hypothetical protein
VKVRKAFGNDTVSHVPDTGRVTSPESQSAFTTRNDPMEPVKTELSHGSKQRIGTDEADDRRHLAQIIRVPRVEFGSTETLIRICGGQEIDPLSWRNDWGAECRSNVFLLG